MIIKASLGTFLLNTYAVPHHVIRISIHSLREEGDGTRMDYLAELIEISIHSLREEGDLSKSLKQQKLKLYFNPLPPRGGRHPKAGTLTTFEIISIHSLREEGDCNSNEFSEFSLISIHSLREEGDEPCQPIHWSLRHFNPLPPRGGRLLRLCFNK